MFKADSHSSIHAFSHLADGFEFFELCSVVKEVVPTIEEFMIFMERRIPWLISQVPQE